MPSTESINTQFQGAFSKLGEGDYSLNIAPPASARVTSVANDGKQAAPGAGTNIAVTGNLAVGYWEVEITTFIGGTTVANLEINNMAFKLGNTTLIVLGNPVPGTAGATDMAKYRIRLDVQAPTPVSVVAIAAATAGSIYYASIVASRIN